MKKIYLKIKHWLCGVGLCNLNSCRCWCHQTIPTGAIAEESNPFEAKSTATQEEEIMAEAAKIKARTGGLRRNNIKKARKNLGIDT